MNYGEQIHQYRMTLEDPIFDELRARYGAPLRAAWESATFPATSSNTVMLVERRPHPNIEFVLHNFMYFCPGFSLTIVCSKDNEAFIRGILGRHQDTTHIIVQFETDCGRDQARDEYNATFMDAEFWGKIRADYILSIQTDCYLRKPLPTSLWTLDYVASPWAWSPVFVGGGGLTFRKKEAVIEMCKYNNSKKVEGEDVFFSNMCLQLKKKVLPLEEAVHIFSESCFVDDPVGVHQWWTYLAQDADAEFQDMTYKDYITIHL
jgi:hypothetical protein